MISKAFDISGKTAIVTGGGTGIGRSIALEFARAGVDVALASRSMDHLAPTTKEIQALGRKALAIPTDVRNVQMVEDMVRQSIEGLGHIDILVNNSGLGFEVPFEKMSPNAWKAIIDIDLTGTYLCSHAIGPHMISRKSGVIINIASIAGRRGAPLFSHYAAAKAAVINLTSSLAAEWGRYNIRVNCIGPGPILTENAKRLFSDKGITDEKEMLMLWGTECALGHCGQPEDIGYAAVYLASEAAGFISGATLFIDGCHGMMPVRPGALDELDPASIV